MAGLATNWRHNWTSAQFPPSVRPHNLATWFWPPSATVVSTEPFSHGTGTLQCLQKEMVTYRHWSVSLRRDSDDVTQRLCSSAYGALQICLWLWLSNPVPWQNWMAAYLGYTLQMKMLFPGWPIMVHDTHTRRTISGSKISVTLLCNLCYFSSSLLLLWSATVILQFCSLIVFSQFCVFYLKTFIRLII